MLKPLIKYTGGKYREYEFIKDLIPNKIKNYHEPFFGGGGIFFQLHNDNRIYGESYINDLSQSLMEFYSSISVDEFKDEVLKISNMWQFIKLFADLFYERYGSYFIRSIREKDETIFMNLNIHDFIIDAFTQYRFNFHNFNIVERIELSINDKLRKFIKKDISDNDDDVSYRCITTSICQAFYFTIRDMYNDWNCGGNYDSYSQLERSAQWLFIREFCYGSMFRFGKNGNFNIPYGGYSYNKKCFSCKLDVITSDEVKTLFKKTNIYCSDFEDVIKNQNYCEDDFMFLDPPYDTTFSEYDGNAFSKEDHIRLFKCLNQCKCKWMMIIGKTDFITGLYKNYNIREYDKQYMYQARGRIYDNKNTTHMIITNYTPNVDIVSTT